MKRINLPEARLAALRKQQLIMAELATAQAAERVAKAQLRVKVEESALQEIADQLMTSGKRAVTLASQAAMGIRSRLEAARHHLHVRHEELKAAQANMLSARTTAEAMESLVERKQDELEYTYQKRAESETDAFVMRTWNTQARQFDG